MGNTIADTLTLSYSDNSVATVAARLIAELDHDSSVLDIVTGYVAPSAWNVIGEQLDAVRRFRLLLGKDYELSSREAKERVEADIQALVRDALRSDLQSTGLPKKSEAEETARLLSFLSRPDNEVDVRVWPDGFLHAKAYILRNSVGVGSANFTANGLLHNRELVAWREDRAVVAQLNAWFEKLWDLSAPYKDDFRSIISSSRFGDRHWTPFEVLIRTLAERYGLELPPALESAMFVLKWFQEDAVYRLMRLLNGPARGAVLADAVGLGKTYMALGIMHHFLYQSDLKRRGRRKPILIIVPASMQRTWEYELRDKGMDWACDLITLQSLREDTNVDALNLGDLVIIDEAHRLRSEGTWFHKVMEIVSTGVKDKQVLLLTATPVHTGMQDLTNLLRVLTKNRRDAWSPAIADFEAYLRRVERREADPFPVLDRAVVRRSRSDLLRAKKEREQAGIADPEPLRLPTRVPSHVNYSQGAAGVPIFDLFADTIRHLRLAPYDLTRYVRGHVQESLFGVQDDQPSELIGLFLAGLLKRFESSLRAIRISLERFIGILEASQRLIGLESPRHIKVKRLREFVLTLNDADSDSARGAMWEALVADSEELDAATYDVEAIHRSLSADVEAVRRLLEALPPESDDPKVARLKALLTDRKELGNKRTLVFTQFRDTATYLHERLQADDRLGIVDVVHGGTPAQRRAELTAWFDPSQGQLAMGLGDPVKVLVATDVLAEGHNLQLAEAVVNFDLHWNPQIVVQRAGRIDRLNSPHDKIYIVSFLPDEGLDAHLGLARAIDQRFGRIHFLGLGDEPVTVFAQDQQARTFEQLRRLYSDDVKIFDELEQTLMLGSTDFMRQPLEAFLRTAAEEKLKEIPVGVQSIKYAPEGWDLGPGVFVAFRYGIGAASESIWRFYATNGHVERDESKIFRAIVCGKSEPRGPNADVEADSGPAALIDWPLLDRVVHDIVDEINRRRSTAEIARGASERSRKLRERIMLLERVAESHFDGIDVLLDRLEQVRIEDFDHDPRYRRAQDALREAERSSDLTAKRQDLTGAVETLRDLVGDPVSDGASEARLATPDDLVLVAWERIISRTAKSARLAPTQEALITPATK